MTEYGYPYQSNGAPAMTPALLRKAGPFLVEFIDTYVGFVLNPEILELTLDDQVASLDLSETQLLRVRDVVDQSVDKVRRQRDHVNAVRRQRAGPGDDTRRWDQEELAAIQREVDRVSRAQATNRRDGDDVDRRLAEFKRRRLEQGRDSDGE